MEVRDIFRNLVSGQFLPDLNYSQYKFSFKTVFYQSAYFYCCCVCAFEHEYLDYITDAGEIDDEKYNKILQNVISGQCPHVDTVSERYVRETSVYAAHIAAAIGPSEAVQDYLVEYEDVYGGRFGLSPFRIAVLKGNISSVALLSKYVPVVSTFPSLALGMKINCAYRTEVHTPVVKIDVLSPAEVCIKEQKRQLLRLVLNPFAHYKGLNKALECTFKDNLKDMQADLLEYIASITKIDILEDCAVSAIVYDQPDALHYILEIILQSQAESAFKTCIWQLENHCKVLNRTVCTDIVQLYLSTDNNKEQGVSPVSSLCLLEEDFGDFNKEIEAKLKANPQIKEAVKFTNVNGTLLHTRQHDLQMYPREVKFLLELGVDVDGVDFYKRKTALSYLLDHQGHHYDVHNIIALRTTTEMLLYENPLAAINENVVELAIEVDEYVETLETSCFDLRGEYIMDNQIHSRMPNSKTDCRATGFFAPLLIERGFPVARDLLTIALEKPLPVNELSYIRHLLQTPRSLMLRCRDVIRSHYKLRQVHRFLEISEMPEEIKDFILLKSYFFNF